MRFTHCQLRRRARTESSASSNASWFGLSETSLLRHGKAARTASVSVLIAKVVIIRQNGTIPANFASLTKIAAVRDEKKNAKSMIPSHKAQTVDALSAPTGRAS